MPASCIAPNPIHNIFHLLRLNGASVFDRGHSIGGNKLPYITFISTAGFFRTVGHIISFYTLIPKEPHTPKDGLSRTVAEKRLVQKVQIGMFVVLIAALPALVYIPEILNYPVRLIFLVAGGIFCITLIILHQYNQRPSIGQGPGTLSVFWLIIIALVPTFLLTLLLHISISYYIVRESEMNPVEQVRCEITGLTGREKKRRRRDGSGVYFAFKGDTIHMKTGFNAVRKIRTDNLYSEYLMVVDVRRAPFNAYVVERWKIIHK